MPHNVSAKRPTEEYKLLARTAVIDALESVGPYFQEEIKLNGDSESDSKIAEMVKRKIRPKVIKVLFHYAVKHRMLDVTVRRPHKSDPDILVRRHREPEISDMPRTLRNLDSLVPDLEEQIVRFVTQCRKAVSENKQEEAS